MKSIAVRKELALDMSENPSVDPVLRILAKYLPNLRLKHFPCNPLNGYTEVFPFKPVKASELLWSQLENEFLSIGCIFMPRDRLRAASYMVYTFDTKTITTSKYSQGLVNGEEGLILLG